MLATVAVAMVLGGVAGVGGAPVALDEVMNRSEQSTLSSPGYDCETWIEKRYSGTEQRVAMQCSRIDEGLHVRGGLDAMWVADSYTPWIGHESEGTKIHSGWVGLAHIRGTYTESQYVS